jgi:hypothetical protein
VGERRGEKDGVGRKEGKLRRGGGGGEKGKIKRKLEKRSNWGWWGGGLGEIRGRIGGIEKWG